MPQANPEELSNLSAEIRPNKTSKKKGSPDPLASAARTIARCIDFACDVGEVIKTVQLIQQEEASKHGELDEDDAERQVREEALSQISPESREQMVRTYYKILQVTPRLKAIVNDPTRSDELAAICTKMNGYIKATRSTDASHLKNCLARYALPDLSKPNAIDPPIVISNDRAEMGLNHPVLARWICPAEHLKEFDKDPAKARKDLASGAISMGAEEFPSLFWSGDLPGGDFNPDRMFDGLFRSYFLKRVGRHIFLGPSHALEDSRRGRSCNAVLNDVATIEAEHIGYISVIARFGISSMAQWSEIEGTLNYITLYRTIVRFIQEADPRWREDLLKWWNLQIFGNESGRQGSSSTTNTNGNSAPRMSMVERMRVQMQAHSAAQTSQSAAASESPELDPALTSNDSDSGPNPPVDPPVASTPLAQTLVLPPGTHTTNSTLPSTVPASPLTVQQVEGTISNEVPVPESSTAVSSSASERVTSTPKPSHAGPPPIPHSPLTDEEQLTLPLTPVTNKSTTASKARGKKRAVVPDDTEVRVESSRAKRPKRNRK